MKIITSSSAAPSSHTGTSINSPDGRTQSQIDHIIINGKWRGSLQDVQVMRNADVGSDHNVLVAMMTLKLRNVKIGMARNQRPDVSKLQDTLIKQKFSIMLRNRFSILQDETALTVDDFNTAMMESPKETIGYTDTCKYEWISSDIWITIEERILLKKKTLDSKSQRESSRSIQRERQTSKDISEETEDSIRGDS